MTHEIISKNRNKRLSLQCKRVMKRICLQQVGPRPRAELKYLNAWSPYLVRCCKTNCSLSMFYTLHLKLEFEVRCLKVGNCRSDVHESGDSDGSPNFSNKHQQPRSDNRYLMRAARINSSYVIFMAVDVLQNLYCTKYCTACYRRDGFRLWPQSILPHKWPTNYSKAKAP